MRAGQEICTSCSTQLCLLHTCAPPSRLSRHFGAPGDSWCQIIAVSRGVQSHLASGQWKEYGLNITFVRRLERCNIISTRWIFLRCEKIRSKHYICPRVQGATSLEHQVESVLLNVWDQLKSKCWPTPQIYSSFTNEYENRGPPFPAYTRSQKSDWKEVIPERWTDF